MLNSLGNSLADLSDSALINTIEFWQLCHKVAKVKESNLTIDYLETYLLLATDDEPYLPTRSLTLLFKAHEVLGENNLCLKNEVEFKNFFKINF